MSAAGFNPAEKLRRARLHTEPMNGPAIETHNLEKTYRTLRGKNVPALRGVSLRVESGSIFGLIGQNGAGKTTLVKILLGLSSPTSGTAQLLGGSPGDPAIRRRVGYLPEAMRIPDYMKAKNFLTYMGRLNRVSSSDLKKRIPRLLEQVGLAGVRKPVKAYSKGMQQRLGLAHAMLNEPEFLFLDEPTDGLDPLGRKDVRDMLVRLRAAGKTIFLNSHLLSEVELVCDRIVILNGGEVARDAAPEDFTRGTGEYIVRVAVVDDAVCAAAIAVLGTNGSSPAWQGTSMRFLPRDRAQLNAVLDKLRAVPVEIESVEPQKISLEQYFLQVVAGGDS
jgi:ABC-2 type transport system ATP-binding protein